MNDGEDAMKSPLRRLPAPKPERSGFDDVLRRGAVRSDLRPEELAYAGVRAAALARLPSLYARRLSLCIIAFFACMIIWAAFAEVDEVTHAEGQIIASQRIQTVQNLEGGILSELLAREGQIVEAGEALARLDNEGAASSYRDALNRAMDHQAAIVRLNAELEGQPPAFPETDAAAWLSEQLGVPVNAEDGAWAQRIFQDQREAWKARLQQKEAELSLLRSQHEQRRQEVEEQKVRRGQLESNLHLTREKVKMIEPLVKSGSYSQVDFLTLRGQEVSLRGELDTLLAAMPRARAAVEEAERRIAFREAELASAITDEINRRRQELASLRENISAGKDRVTRTELRSPVRGSVRSVYINTVGGVVRPGEAIMDIVPLEGALLVEARVRPSDVAFLRTGQTAMVKISAYDFAIYGGLRGRLEQISADTIEDKRGEVFYLVRVRTESNSISYRGDKLDIMPGMLATVDIMIGKKTVLDYILKPVLKARQNALREK
jgi:adhesin transport system membrane fusion protein